METLPEQRRHDEPEPSLDPAPSPGARCPRGLADAVDRREPCAGQDPLPRGALGGDRLAVERRNAEVVRHAQREERGTDRRAALSRESARQLHPADRAEPAGDDPGDAGRSGHRGVGRAGDRRDRRCARLHLQGRGARRPGAAGPDRRRGLRDRAAQDGGGVRRLRRGRLPAPAEQAPGDLARRAQGREDPRARDQDLGRLLASASARTPRRCPMRSSTRPCRPA